MTAPDGGAGGLPWSTWLPRQRWYAGRDRVLASARTGESVALRDGLELVFVDARYADGSTDRYQVVVQWDREPRPDRAAESRVGAADGLSAYDAVYQPDSARFLYSMIDRSETIDGVRFRREPGVVLATDVGSRVIGGEQSNTSVVFGEHAILKMFRRVACGISPDIELHRVLGAAANPHVPPLLGTIETTRDGQPCPLGMLTRYVADSVDGWSYATGGTRDLDAGEAYRLGEAVASVHTTLAAELGTQTRRFPVEIMRERLARELASTPALGVFAPAIEKRYAALADTEITTQRIHGDLHLGQVLRTRERWLLIDFEGEPGQPPAQRREPDSVLRDVAGMLRSFAYAAVHGEPAERARDWTDRTGAAFCAGYASAGPDPRGEPDVLAAYELDKAVYEAGYEARHRPGWLHIPMDAIARLLD